MSRHAARPQRLPTRSTCLAAAGREGDTLRIGQVAKATLLTHPPSPTLLCPCVPNACVCSGRP